MRPAKPARARHQRLMPARPPTPRTPPSHRAGGASAGDDDRATDSPPACVEHDALRGEQFAHIADGLLGGNTVVLLVFLRQRSHRQLPLAAARIRLLIPSFMFAPL